MNKASWGDGIPAELFQILKDDAVKALHPICQQIWRTQQWPQNWKRSVFIPIPKKGNAKECSNYCTTSLISHESNIMLKILQARLQQYLNWEIPHVQTGYKKGRETIEQIANIHWITGKAREFQKNIYFCFTDYAKAYDYGSQETVKNSSRDGSTRTPYLPPEKPVKQVKKQQLELDMGQKTGSKLGKEYDKSVYCHSAYLPYMQSSIQLLSRVWLLVTHRTAGRQASLSITNSQSLPKLMSNESVMPSNHLILCRPFFFLLQSFPASESFPISQLFALGGQSIGVSASTSVLPMNIQDWSPLGWTTWISLKSKGLSRVFSSTIVQKHQFFSAQLSSQSNSHIHTWPLKKS